MNEPITPLPVAILALPEATASVVYGMFDLFMSAGRDWGMIVDGRPGPQLIAPRVVSAAAGPFTAANGIQIVPHGPLDASATVICVPELMISPTESLDGRFAAEVAWVRERYERGAIIATACSGAVLLAEAGLLDGEEATTHWAFAPMLAKRHPRIKLRPKQALVTAGNGHRLVMAGGGVTWLDLALYLIARVTSIEAAMHVARVSLIDWHESGQQPFARLARSSQAEDAVIAGCQEWIARHYEEPAPVAAMVRLSGLPERSFKRRFKEATGMGPLEYVHTLRLEEAKQMLEATSDTVESIAAAVGYEDAGFFGRLFRRHVQLTPVQYRKRFGSMRRRLAQYQASRMSRQAVSMGSNTSSQARALGNSQVTK